MLTAHLALDARSRPRGSSLVIRRRRLATVIGWAIAAMGAVVAPYQAAAQCVAVGGNVPAPVKTVHVEPVYPPAAITARIQGIVILEATIQPDGTVSSATVLRSIPLLDPAAIAAVLQWRYAARPGGPCVLMSVTVIFTLPQDAVAPTNLQAAVSGNVLSLSWQPPTTPPSGYLIEAGTGPGLSNIAAVPVPANPPGIAAPVPNGTYYIRVRAVLASGVSAPSNEVIATVGCTGVPAPPGGFAVSQGPGGNPVQFSWTAPAVPVTAYRLEAGTGPGLANLVTVPLAGSATSFAVQAPPGTYYVRLRAQSACGLSAPSTEVVVTVGSSCTAPAAPTLTASVSGTLVSLNWTTPPGTAPITYTLAAGSSPGASNLVVAPLGQATSFQGQVPPGTYFVRVVASNSCGTSDPSNEVTLVVGAPAGAPQLTFTITPNPVPYAGFINVGCGGATVPGKTWIYTLRMTNQGTATFVIASFVARVTAPGLAPVDVPYSASTFALAFGGSTIAPQASRQGTLCVIGNWEDATLQWTFHHTGGGSFTTPVISFLRP